MGVGRRRGSLAGVCCVSGGGGWMGWGKMRKDVEGGSGRGVTRGRGMQEERSRKIGRWREVGMGGWFQAVGDIASVSLAKSSKRMRASGVPRD